MALKIRLRRQGRRNRPFYRLVVADAQSPRDGKYVETIGQYNPLAHVEEEELKVLADRAEHWLSVGAQCTEKAAALIRRGAPEVMKAYEQKMRENQKKRTEKRRARKKSSVAA